MKIRQPIALLIAIVCTASAPSEEVIWKASKPKTVVRAVAHQEPLPAAKEPAKPSVMSDPARMPALAIATNKLPIDLETAFRLANAQNPTIASAWARVREATARQDQAEVLWLPNLTVGGAYVRHDGQTQNQRGEVFGVSRSSVFGGGGAQLRVDTSEALFQPLIARRLSQAETANARATVNFTQLDVALAYLDLVQTYGYIAVNEDTLTKAEKMLELARAAEKSGVSKTAGDINRARTEVSLRRQERIELEGRSSVASARLARILLLTPGTELVPADPVINPVALISNELSLDDLIGLALRNRPDLEANRAAALAAWERTRQAKIGPLVPRLQVDYLAGTFGGGRNDYVGTFSARGDLSAQAYWELRNFGFGNAAQIRERRAQQNQASLRVVEVQARIAAEVNEALAMSLARQRALDDAQEGVREAAELYRKLLATQFGMVGPNPRYDPLESLLAIQSLNQARVQHLNQVIEYNRAQFRLFTSIGSPTECALPNAVVQPVPTPVLPSKGDTSKK